MAALTKLSLDHVVSTLSGPIREEHAWAILYQGITRLHEVSTESCYLLGGLSDLLLTGDGRVHEDSFLEKTSRGVQRTPMTSFSSGIAELGVVVFEALDWGIPEGMSRRLSEELEALIDLMVSADDQDQQDEGISIGEEEMVSSLCRKITHSCRRHHSPVSPLPSSNCPLTSFLQVKSDGAEVYYRQVCQDLVEQVNDISDLMKKLNLKDWRDLDTSDLDTSEQDSKKLRATFSDVSSGFSENCLSNNILPLPFKIGRKIFSNFYLTKSKWKSANNRIHSFLCFIDTNTKTLAMLGDAGTALWCPTAEGGAAPAELPQSQLSRDVDESDQVSQDRPEASGPSS